MWVIRRVGVRVAVRVLASARGMCIDSARVHNLWGYNRNGSRCRRGCRYVDEVRIRVAGG